MEHYNWWNKKWTFQHGTILLVCLTAHGRLWHHPTVTYFFSEIGENSLLCRYSHVHVINTLSSFQRLEIIHCYVIFFFLQWINNKRLEIIEIGERKAIDYLEAKNQRKQKKCRLIIQLRQFLLFRSWQRSHLQMFHHVMCILIKTLQSYLSTLLRHKSPS